MCENVKNTGYELQKIRFQTFTLKNGVIDTH